jgi:hypothetical protein
MGALLSPRPERSPQPERGPQPKKSPQPTQSGRPVLSKRLQGPFAAPESADYRLDVVVTTAQIRHKMFSFVPDDRVVLQVQLTFRETGQRIGEFEIHQRSEYVTTGLSYVVRRSVEEIIRVLKDE